jgi:hypothetical protein
VPSVADQFAADLSRMTGVDAGVIRGWELIEGADAPGGTGGFNMLNLRPFSSDTGVASHSPRGFDRFASLGAAEVSTARRIEQPFIWRNPVLGGPGLGTVVAAHGTPQQQIAAISASGWDHGHYTRGGVVGQALLDAYSKVTGGGSSDPRLNPTVTLPQGEPGGLAGVTPHNPVPGVTSAAQAAADAAKKAAAATESVGSFLGKLSDPNFLLRLLQIGGGGLVTIAGLVLLVKEIGLKAALPSQVSNAPGVKQTAAAAEENDPVAAAYEKGRQQGREARARSAGRRRESRPARQRTAERNETRSRSAASERRNRIEAESASISDEVPFL